MVGAHIAGEWRIAALNLVGSVAFGISAIAAFWVPTEGSVVDLAAANAFTALGGLCFLIGALLLLPEGARESEAGVTEVTHARGVNGRSSSWPSCTTP